MSVSGPSPLGTLMVQRVEAALGSTLAQQANIATGARPDAVTQPGQPDKTDPAKNPPPKEQEGSRRAQEQSGRQGNLAALARSDPEIAKLLAARNAPMTGYTASAPTTLGEAAKTILALLQQFPDARPAVAGRAPLLGQAPGQGGAAQGSSPGAGAAAHGGTSQGAGTPAAGAGGHPDLRTLEALLRRGQGEGGTAGNTASAQGSAARAAAGGPASPGHAAGGAAAPAGQGWATGGPAGGQPLPTGMAGPLALALSQALQGSGLFYESHLRDFAFGQRTLGQMLAEPQALAGRETANPGGAQARGGTETAGQQATSQAGQQQGGQQAAQAGGAHLAGALLGLDPSTHALVRQQLETLANQGFAWQGEAWPGTDLEWEVQRRTPRHDEPEATDQWATRLNLRLPGLGEVQARLSLSGTQLVMHLASPEGAGIMAEHTEMLRRRLEAQGLRLSQLVISRETGDGGEPA